MQVREVMTPDPVTVAPECTLERAVRLLEQGPLRHLPVVDHHRLVGILSERDALTASGWAPDRYRDGAGGKTQYVGDIMSVSVETTAPDEEVPAAARSLLSRRIGCLPVLAGGALVGALSETDLLAAYVRACKGRRGDGTFDPDLASVMDPEPITIGPDATAAEGLALCRSARIRHLPVVADGWFVGIVSDRDLRLCEGRGESDTRKIGECMATDLGHLDPASPLSEAAWVMDQRGIGSVAVTEAGGRLAGIVTTTDVLAQWTGADLAESS